MEPTPALVRLDASDADGVPVLAYALRGSVTGADVDAMSADLVGHDRARLLLRIDSLEFPAASAFASKVSAVSRFLRTLERYALVGGPHWLAGYASVAGALTPVDVRHFDDEAAARAWLAAPATADEAADRAAAVQQAAPAVTRLPSGRPDLVAFHIDGTLSARDSRDVIAPAIEAALTERGAIDALVVFGHFGGMSLGAAREDLALATHVRSVRRMALAGGPAWMTAAVDTVGKLLPVEVRTFGDEDAARAWLGEAA